MNWGFPFRSVAPCGALEDFVGKRLFTRQHQAMKLTEDGQSFYNAVSPKLEHLAEAVRSQMETSNVMRLHLGVPTLYAGERLFPHLPELRKLHPRLHIDIDTGSQLESRLGDSLDAAIILSKGPDSMLHAVRLGHNPVLAFASLALAAEIGPKPDAARLSKHTFLISSACLKVSRHGKARWGWRIWSRPRSTISIRRS
jgi:LysR family glycine cleavage system transcriptional activator